MAASHFLVEKGTFLLANKEGCPRVAYLPVGTALDIGKPVEIVNCRKPDGDAQYLPVVTSLGFTGFIDPNESSFRELEEDVIVVVSEDGVKGQGGFYYYSDDIYSGAVSNREERYRLIKESQAVTRSCGHFAIVNDGIQKSGFIRVIGKMCDEKASNMTTEPGWFPKVFVDCGKAVKVMKNSANDYLVSVKKMGTIDVRSEDFIDPLGLHLADAVPQASYPDYKSIHELSGGKQATFCPVEYEIVKNDVVVSEVRVCKHYVVAPSKDKPVLKSVQFCYRHNGTGEESFKCSSLVSDTSGLRFVQNAQCTEKLFAFKYKDKISAEAPYQPYNELEKHLRMNHNTGSGDVQIEWILRNIILFEASCLQSGSKCQSPSKAMNPKEFKEIYF